MTAQEAKALDPKARVKRLAPRAEIITINTPPKKAADGALTYIGSGIFLDGKLTFITLSLSWIGALPNYVLGQNNFELLQKELRGEMEGLYGVASAGPVQTVLGLNQAQTYSWSGEKFKSDLILPVRTSGKNDDLVAIVTLTQGLDAQSALEMRVIQRLMQKPFEE
ncbi:MAG: hypothetical protein M0D55_16090 [Elusimicrobiota bacterium]|nr:MAG: hypothetical protein M0D55_16090 [Elusimicrobiota bacterium]